VGGNKHRHAVEGSRRRNPFITGYEKKKRLRDGIQFGDQHPKGSQEEEPGGGNRTKEARRFSLIASPPPPNPKTDFEKKATAALGGKGPQSRNLLKSEEKSAKNRYLFLIMKAFTVVERSCPNGRKTESIHFRECSTYRESFVKPYQLHLAIMTSRMRRPRRIRGASLILDTRPEGGRKIEKHRRRSAKKLSQTCSASKSSRRGL